MTLKTGCWANISTFLSFFCLVQRRGDLGSNLEDESRCCEELLDVAWACFEERLAFVADGVTGNQVAETSVAAISEERKSWQQSR
ncbi:hypothetical protein Peur_000713 [Populus x canadensis]